MDESKLQSALLGWIIALAITISVLLRRDKDLRQKLFTVFSGNVTLYYLVAFLFQLLGTPWLERLSLMTATFIPIGGIHFFRTFSPASRQRRSKLVRLAVIIALALAGFCLDPATLKPALGPAILAYVLGFLLVTMFDLNVQAQSATTRLDAARIRYLAGGGFVTLALQVVDRMDHVFDVYVPPVGLAMTLLYFYFISQSIVRYRILDFYELFGRLVVMTMMGLLLAVIYVFLVRSVGTGEGFFLNAFLASLVILLLFDPLRDFVEQKISDFFFGERLFFEQSMSALGFKLAHVFDIPTMVKTLLTGLEHSKRITHASLYLIDAHGSGYDLHDWIGPKPEQTRIDVVSARRFLRTMAHGGSIVTSNLESRRERSLQAGRGETTEDIDETIGILARLHADVVLFLEGEDDLLGFLIVKDERVRDSFSAEEIKALIQLSSQAAITVENSQLYQKMKERDRLAALGEMSAGMAHEIRNPLGAIKAAAQFIEEDLVDGADDNDDAEYLGIIVEEANRLNRVVNDFLAYARPSRGVPALVNVNDILQRTIQVFEAGKKSDMSIVTQLDERLSMVHIDSERLHQAFLNLIINADQAMIDTEEARLEVVTRIRKVRRMNRPPDESSDTKYVEIRFIDNGPGIDPATLENIFIPFFTTKQSGSGLGLPVCQRLIRDSGGDIEVRSRMGQGCIFSVVLPAISE